MHVDGTEGVHELRGGRPGGGGAGGRGGRGGGVENDNGDDYDDQQKVTTYLTSPPPFCTGYWLSKDKTARFKSNKPFVFSDVMSTAYSCFILRCFSRKCAKSEY